MDNPGFRDKSPSLSRQESKLDLWIAAGRSGPGVAGATRVQWIAAAPCRSAVARVALQDQGAIARQESKPQMWVCGFLGCCASLPASADRSVIQIRAIRRVSIGSATIAISAEQISCSASRRLGLGGLVPTGPSGDYLPSPPRGPHVGVDGGHSLGFGTATICRSNFARRTQAQMWVCAKEASLLPVKPAMWVS